MVRARQCDLIGLGCSPGRGMFKSFPAASTVQQNSEITDNSFIISNPIPRVLLRPPTAEESKGMGSASTASPPSFTNIRISGDGMKARVPESGSHLWHEERLFCLSSVSSCLIFSLSGSQCLHLSDIIDPIPGFFGTSHRITCDSA